MGKKMIRVVHALPHAAATVREVDDSLATLQELVGGDLAGFTGLDPLRQAHLHVYINDNGRNLGLEANCVFGAGPFDNLVGPIVVSRANDEGDEIGLTETEATFAATFLDRLRAWQGLLSTPEKVS